MEVLQASALLLLVFALLQHLWNNYFLIGGKKNG